MTDRLDVYKLIIAARAWNRELNSDERQGYVAAVKKARDECEVLANRIDRRLKAAEVGCHVSI